MVKISRSLRNFRDRIRVALTVKTVNFLFFIAIFLVFILAILIRLSPVLRGPWLIKAFDPWIQWYNAEYLSTHSLYEYFNWTDTKSWYPSGFYRGGLRPGLTFTVVTIYEFLNFLGLPISLYDVCYFFPAFMGGITVLVMYFLGKEVHNRGTGLIAAFFLAFNPGYMQRTVAGFFDNETIGVFATLMTFLFFLKALKTGRLFYSILGGISLGYLSLSWGGYQFVYLIIPVIAIILILTDKYSENILISYAGVEGTGLLIFSLYIKFDFNTLFEDLEIGGIFLFTIILILFHIIHTKRNEHPGIYRGLIGFVKWALIPGIIIFAVILWVVPEILPFGFGARFLTILNPLFREQINLVASVAEQMPSAWSVFYYHTFIPLILIPLGIYFCFKRLSAADIFMITFLILIFYFTGSMIRIILIFAPAASLVAGYGLGNILKIFGSFLGERKIGVSRKRKRQLEGTVGKPETIVVYIIVGFLGFAQVVHATDISIDQLSYGQLVPGTVIHDWEESLTYMKTNLPGTSVVVSWWDYGYWLTPIGNMTTVNDNATKNQTRIGLTGMAMMQTNEIYSAKALRKLKADYVLVFFGFLINGLGGDEGKWPWMLRICNDNYEKYKRMGMVEDNWGPDSVFVENEYQNQTNGAMGDKWFQSQLVRMMFYGETTDQASTTQGSFENNYASEINSRIANDGRYWIEHIPTNGNYNFTIFAEEYISRYGLVKLFKVDYTALDSSFFIKNPQVFDNGYATFKIKNSGTKDLIIKRVAINGVNYGFSMGKGNDTQILENGDEDIVWVDIKSKGTIFNEDDIARINVTAKSEALEGRNYYFSNATSNFFVKKAEPGAIKINKENSKAIHIDAATTDLRLEVENVGKTIELLDRFYVNNDTAGNRFIKKNIEYLSGTPILLPGEKATIYLGNAPASFFPIRKYNKIGVSTINNASDEVLFTSSMENFSLSILSEERIVSPEKIAIFDTYFRSHVPINFTKTHAYTYNNGTTTLKIYVKNTGDIIFGIDSIYLTESLTEVDFADFYTKSGKLNLEKNDEDIIIVDATNYVNSEVNEEILVCVTGSFEGTVASDIGFIHTVKNEQDIQIIDNIDGIATSFIYANETGKLLIKNTGDEPVTLDDIYLNNTLATNVEFQYGNASLGIQECAIITFEIPGLNINESNQVNINVTTTSTAQAIDTLKAHVDSRFYNITIDDIGTTAFDTGNLTIIINNNGLRNVTIESVYINNTFIPLINFTENIFEIGAGDSLQLTVLMDDLKIIMLPISIVVGDKLEILVRTKEGAEYTQEVVVE